MNYEEFKELWLGPENYIVCRTSGSTGKPKDIKLSKADMKRSSLATINFFEIPENSTFVCPISLDYIGGKMMAVRSIISNGNFFELPPSNSFELREDADLIAIVPSQVPALLKSFDSVNIKNVIIGGAPISGDTGVAIAKTGINAWQTYGMTETASHVALAKIGTVHPVFEAIDKNWFETDERGCLIINRPGYDLNRAITNDVVELISPVKFRWLGRFDNIINSGGIKINPEELETKIEIFFPILKNIFYIRGKIDKKWGTVPELVVEGHVSEETINEVLSGIKELIDPRICPKTAAYIPKIERTPNGKIIRR